MQVDAASEENDNVEVETNHVVDSTTLVSLLLLGHFMLVLQVSLNSQNSLFVRNIFDNILLQDVEVYASTYKGLARLSRLMYVADHCPPLRVETLRMALQHVMSSYNTSMYQQIHKKLQEAITR